MSINVEQVWEKTVTRKGKKIKIYITGSWSYHWSADRFWIRLNQSTNTRGFYNHEFQVADDHPEFGDWKLVKDRAEMAALYKKHKPKPRSFRSPVRCIGPTQRAA